MGTKGVAVQWAELGGCLFAIILVLLNLALLAVLPMYLGDFVHPGLGLAASVLAAAAVLWSRSRSSIGGGPAWTFGPDTAILLLNAVNAIRCCGELLAGLVR